MQLYVAASMMKLGFMFPFLRRYIFEKSLSVDAPRQDLRTQVLFRLAIIDALQPRDAILSS
jgi:hypothetical protein